ncbi:LOW QUALITY PROTEIN: uncharacterized protein LOC129591257 [Paramacrobiotus metropolitanus]|uniref:LOW QUALITY PROTEIN: uncharacterized protein LOC129591257 n=1 Tax=Paramacrobiotus metropolitanus TaxID=2943436 RepID=UPI002446351C|nr:LOW QUALITY PROTEIN: uncharacterized protein LOC129591257 [Paramacrobiotus metropolitanus]
MTTQKCGLYCVLQNYPFANYIAECELCLCGLFMERLPAFKANSLANNGAVCISGTGLVGVGIHAAFRAASSTATTSPTGSVLSVEQLIAGIEYDFLVKIWHWNRLGFVTVVWDLGNDSLRPNDTVEIQNNGFGFLRKKIKYSAPGEFRLRIVADDGFNEVFRDIPIQVLPSEGKTAIAITPRHPAVKESIGFRAPEFDDQEANFMWFFQDSISFHETTTSVAQKTYEEPGVYRVDVAVTTANLSKTGSIDILVESPLEGLHVNCEATVNANRIVSIAGSVDKGTNYAFSLENGHDFADPINSPSGRFRVLYSQAGFYNLSLKAKNSISTLQTSFGIRVVDPDMITVKRLDFPSSAVVNETTPLKIIPDSDGLQDSFIEWFFSDNTQATGQGLFNVRKIFRTLGDIHIRIVITGKRGSRRIFHAVISVVTLCTLTPSRGKSLQTRFQFMCRGSLGPLPGLEIHHAIIANPVLGFYDVLYPKTTQSLILPDPLSVERNWTVAFPGSSKCDMRPQCGSNCCPVFNINATFENTRPVAEIIDVMQNILQQTDLRDRDHHLSILIVQSSILVRTNATDDQLGAVTKIVARIAEEVSGGFEMDRKISLGGHLYDLLTVLTWTDNFRVTPKDAARTADFLVKFVRDMAPHTNVVPPKDGVFGLLKRLLNGLPVAGDESTAPSDIIPVVDLLRPLGQLVGNYINEISDRSVSLTSDVTITAVKRVLPPNGAVINVGGLVITLPAKLSSALASSEVVIVVSRSSQNWDNREPAGAPEVFSVLLLDRNYTEIDLTQHTQQAGIKIVLPSERNAGNHLGLQARMQSVPLRLQLLPNAASRFRILKGQQDQWPADRLYMTLQLRSNSTLGNATGRVSVGLVDGGDRVIEKRIVTYDDLRNSDVTTRWNFAATNGQNYLSLTNEGGLFVEVSAELHGTKCVEGKDPGDLVRTDCEPDSSSSAQNMRTCVCNRLASFGGRLFEINDFLSLERTVELMFNKRSGVTVATLGIVAAVFIVALIATTIRFRPLEEFKQILSVGSGKIQLDVLFWQRMNNNNDFQSGLFPLRLHICGAAGRLEHVLSFQRQSAFGSSLLVSVFCDRHPGIIASVRITGRLIESTFPFQFATVYDPRENALTHFRLMPPRLIEEPHGRAGVVFEVSSKQINFSAGLIMLMECRKRIKKDHLWVAAVRLKGSLLMVLELQSAAVTMLFGMMGMCAVQHSLFGTGVDDVHELTKVFRPKSKDLVAGLWSVLIVSPIITIIVEILQRCHHRSANAIPTVEVHPNADDRANNAAETFYDNEGRDSEARDSPVAHPERLKDPYSHGINPSFSHSLPSIIRMNDDHSDAMATQFQAHAAPYSTILRANTHRSMSTIPSEGTPILDTKSTIHSRSQLCASQSATATGTLATNQEIIPANPIENYNRFMRNEKDTKSKETHSAAWSIPAVCRQILAYILCFTLSALSICLVLFLGLNFGSGMSLHWLISVLAAFLISFFVMEPLKVIGKSLWVPYHVTSLQYFQKKFARCRHGLTL